MAPDDQERLYIYSLSCAGRTQIGIVCLSSVKDYEEGRIKKHELTLPSKVEDRTKVLYDQKANTGPIFLFQKNSEHVNSLIQEATHEAPYIAVVTEDSVRHSLWKVSPILSKKICRVFKKQIESTYIADGHHRAQSAYAVCQALKAQALKKGETVTGKEPFNFFMTIIFSEGELKLGTYPRLVQKEKGITEEKVLEGLEKDFEVSLVKKGENPTPQRKNCFSVYISQKWYCLKLKAGSSSHHETCPLSKIDVNLVSSKIIQPLFSILDIFRPLNSQDAWFEESRHFGSFK